MPGNDERGESHESGLFHWASLPKIPEDAMHLFAGHFVEGKISFLEFQVFEHGNSMVLIREQISTGRSCGFQPAISLGWVVAKE